MNKGITLIGVHAPVLPFMIAGLKEELKLELGIGEAFQRNEGYIVLAMGYSASANVYLLTKNDLGEFIWVPSWEADVRVMQQGNSAQRRILVPA